MTMTANRSKGSSNLEARLSRLAQNFRQGRRFRRNYWGIASPPGQSGGLAPLLLIFFRLYFSPSRVKVSSLLFIRLFVLDC
ncbi:hypothetical protein BJX76DRAFT_273238 [Aspergillus varians]